MEFQPPLPLEGSLEADPGSYDRIFGRFYEGLFGAGLQADVVYPQQLGSDAEALVARWPVLVVPALYVADDILLDLLDTYARAGGHLVLGFRSGYADDEARPRAEVMPGRLREAVGASYGEYTNLAVPVPLRPEEGFALPEGAAATAWADALVLEGADMLVGYEHPHLGRWAAVTTHAHGRGRVTYVGTLPDRSLAVALARWLRPAPDVWEDRPETVTVTSARNAAGGRLRFVSNWSWEPTSFALPVAARDLLSATDLGVVRRWSWRRGMSGCFWRAPGGETTRRRVHREGRFEAQRSSLAACSGRDVCRVGRGRPGVRRSAAAAVVAADRRTRSTWPPSSRSRRPSRCGPGRPAPTRP